MEHKYYLLNRPPMIGTHPRGATALEVWSPVQMIPGTERHAHGWVEYPEALDFKLVWRYELMPIDDSEADNYYFWRNEVGK